MHYRRVAAKTRYKRPINSGLTWDFTLGFPIIPGGIATLADPAAAPVAAGVPDHPWGCNVDAARSAQAMAGGCHGRNGMGWGVHRLGNL